MSRKPYIRPVSNYGWWLSHPRYVRYMAREASCILIGAYSGLLVVGLLRLAQGEGPWNAFLQSLKSPGGIGFLVIALCFAIYHTTTWFNVTPKAMPLQIGAKPVAPMVIVGAHYGLWAVVSVIVLILVGM